MIQRARATSRDNAAVGGNPSSPRLSSLTMTHNTIWVCAIEYCSIVCANHGYQR